MESNRITQWFTTVGDWLNEQVWFQQLKSKWDELDPQSQTYLKIAGTIGAILVVLFMLLSAVWGVHRQKSELVEKTDLLNVIQNGNDELRRLKESTPAVQAVGGDKTAEWPQYFEAIAGTAGIDKASISTSPEKPGTSSDLAKEVLFDLNARHITIKQAVRLAYYLENGARPVKVRNMLIDTKSDPTGYLDTTLAVSAFTLEAEKAPKK